jgi:hypothetical protein
MTVPSNQRAAKSFPGAAIASGWGAIEALLGEPSNRAGAADTLALWLHVLLSPTEN